MKRYRSKVLNILRSCPTSVKASSPSKISTKQHCSFNLPPGISCPGKTQACEGCYAIHKRSLFSNVIKRTTSNWLGIKKIGSNKDRLVKRLMGVVPVGAEIYRIHSSGDFFSQDYLDAWTEVIRRRPDVKFWAYTRSFGLNFQRLVRLPNFNLYASTDQYNMKSAQVFVSRYSRSRVRHAYGPWEHDWNIPDNSFACPVTTKKIKTDGACERCKLCVEKGRTSKNVVFMRH